MLIILRDLQDSFDPDNGLAMDTLGPQQHILGYGFTFGQYTLNGPNVLTEDQEEDMFAQRSGMMDPCFEDDPSISILARKVGNPLRLPFCGAGQ